ncbi:unnamed protein product [Urochloa humidicola]
MSRPPAPMLSVPKRKSAAAELFRDRPFFGAPAFNDIRDARAAVAVPNPQAQPPASRRALILRYHRLLFSARGHLKHAVASLRFEKAASCSSSAPPPPTAGSSGDTPQAAPPSPAARIQRRWWCPSAPLPAWRGREAAGGGAGRGSSIRRPARGRGLRARAIPPSGDEVEAGYAAPRRPLSANGSPRPNGRTPPRTHLAAPAAPRREPDLVPPATPRQRLAGGRTRGPAPGAPLPSPMLPGPLPPAAIVCL